jgi:rhodanese-related sulfurtransferase
MRNLLLILFAISIIFAAGCKKAANEEYPPAAPKVSSASPAQSVAQQKKKGGVVNITPEQLQVMIDSKEPIVLVDVRLPDELTSPIGKIDGVVNIPLGEFPLRYKQLDQKKKIVLICRSGNRSVQAAKYLIDNGYKDVYNLDGGMIEYRAMLDSKKK